MATLAAQSLPHTTPLPPRLLLGLRAQLAHFTTLAWHREPARWLQHHKQEAAPSAGSSVGAGVPYLLSGCSAAAAGKQCSTSAAAAAADSACAASSTAQSASPPAPARSPSLHPLRSRSQARQRSSPLPAVAFGAGEGFVSTSASLAHVGAMQCERAAHTAPVLAAAAGSYVAVTACQGGRAKVWDAREGQMRAVACLAAPGLTQGRACLSMWRDGSRAVLGNAEAGAAWVLDIEGGTSSVQLAGGCLSSDAGVGGSMGDLVLHWHRV